MKRNSGITLIALTVTIIVLIILAGISIGALTGDNGLINQTRQAKEETEISEERKIINLSVTQAMEQNKWGKLEKEKLENELKNNIPNEKTSVFTGSDNFIVIFEEENRAYEVDVNGNVTGPQIIEIDPDAGNITKDAEGTEESPYYINCIEDLVAFSKLINNNEINRDCYVILTKNLDFESISSYANYKATYIYDETKKAYIQDEMSSTSLMELCTKDKGFIPIGTGANDVARFQGNLEGNGYEIKNIYVNSTGNAGLFGGSYDATISNLGVTGMIETSGGYAGGIVANGIKTSYYNCYNKANVKGTRTVGGIVAHGSWAVAVMQNCYNTGEIVGDGEYAGGLAGTYGGEIIDCYNWGNVTNKSDSAGIVGEAAGVLEITNCYNKGNIEGANSTGIIADAYGETTVNNCYNTGAINMKYYRAVYHRAQGIGGTYSNNCYNIGKLTSIIEEHCCMITTGTVNKGYYLSSLATGGEVIESETIDVEGKTAEEFVALLNSYTDDTGVYPENWKKWKVGEDGYPTFE